MAKTNWTSDQKRVIDTRDNSILVSAAAGSGKTAVLVERIISMITDREDPVDVDRILVVTFTRAAAREMKERVYKRLSAMFAEDPSNIELSRQMTLVHNAPISTIDSFAAEIVKSYYYMLGIDGDLRMGDEGEMKLLAASAMDEMMEEAYDRGEESFLSLVGVYKSRERDTKLTAMVEKLCRIAMSYPWPEEYLNTLRMGFDIKSEEQLMEMPLLKELVLRSKESLREILGQTRSMLEELSETGHPYTDAIASDLIMFEELCKCDTYGELHERLSNISYATLSRKKADFDDEELKLRVKAQRDAMKESVKKIAELFAAAPEDIIEEQSKTAPFANELIDLALAYMDKFAEKKRERKLMDFGDLEHFALDILIDRETKEPTEVALERRGFYREVMVDEYQDSNLLQELILSAISHVNKNYFMVGDVKQSIYGFRQARPDIFTGKYKSYTDDPLGQLRIDLSRNFRSRKEVLDITNEVFSTFMDEKIGMVSYDERAALHVGADYPEGMGYDSELIIVPTESDAFEDNEEGIELEARAIGNRIRQMVGVLPISDGKGGTRALEYGDIAILNRSANSVGEKISTVLKEMGIPSELTSRSGYFSSTEVERVLCMLSVINNPYSDIDLTSMLKSPVFAFTDEELLSIRQLDPKKSFALLFLSDENDLSSLSDAVLEKRQRVLDFINKMRQAAEYEPIDSLLHIIYEETGYPDNVLGLVGGAVRRGNLEKLLDLAASYASGSYKGIYSFIRYIEKLKKYEVDYGCSDEDSGGEQVRIMTIHKSKGLEFPVVFICGMSKRFRDDNKEPVVHPEYGMGLDLYDEQRSLRVKTFMKKTIAYMGKAEDLGEELRILYVAMTRAREKLIMTASLKNSDIEKIGTKSPVSEMRPFFERIGVSNYLDMVVPVFLKATRRSSFFIMSPEELLIKEVMAEGQKPDMKTFLSELESVSDHSVSDRLKSIDEFKYDVGQGIEWKSKYSVSTVKKKAYELLQKDLPKEETELFKEDEDRKQTLPVFMGGSPGVKSGAERGTAMHRFLECFDFNEADPASAVEAEIERQTKGGFLTDDQASLLLIPALKRFLSSDMASRMKAALSVGRLYREKAFVMGDKPSVFFSDMIAGEDVFSEDDPLILIQGIIDAYFIENEKLYVLDYKTDKVSNENELLKKYQKQMRLYGLALSRMWGLDIGGLYMYSFALEKLVSVKEQSDGRI